MDVLKDSNIEDIDLSKVAAKALHNMTSVKSDSKKSVSTYWNNETIKKLELIYPENLDDLEKIVALE